MGNMSGGRREARSEETCAGEEEVKWTRQPRSLKRGAGGDKRWNGYGRKSREHDYLFFKEDATVIALEADKSFSVLLSHRSNYCNCHKDVKRL